MKTGIHTFSRYISHNEKEYEFTEGSAAAYELGSLRETIGWELQSAVWDGRKYEVTIKLHPWTNCVNDYASVLRADVTILLSDWSDAAIGEATCGLPSWSHLAGYYLEYEPFYLVPRLFRWTGAYWVRES